MPSYAPPQPWRAAERINGLIPIRTTSEPIQDVCFVPTDRGSLRTERTVAWIEQCSDLMASYASMEPAGVVATVRRIANLAIVGFSTVGIALGFVAAMS